MDDSVETENLGRQERQRLSGPIALAALGVVFGDIGTSPLYTLKTCFTTAHVEATPENVLGITSALIWTLMLVVCVKYVTFVMQVDYNGEGGIFALLARITPPPKSGVYPPLGFLTVVAIIGGAALFGDGLITPAISVLSAVEGLSVVSKDAVTWEVPITIGILVGLFIIQWRGTEKVGIIFGPVMALWFLAIGVAGVIGLAGHPQILHAINPVHALRFLTHHGIFGFLVLGATILCVTGAEALYADMSHFGRGPITLAWYAIVFPALVLNYLGQGGMVIANPHALDNAFYALTPGWTLIPMIVLATAATVIASQALISGAFTLVEQGIALNLVPRMNVVHTSNRYPGQVYVPSINVLLAIGCVALVVIFRTSDALASAYGLAVALTMLATSILFHAVVVRVLKWNIALANTVFVGFLLMDCSFVLAGLGKIPVGGWLPLAIAAVLTFVATTWYDGRRRMLKAFASFAIPVDEFLRDVKLSDSGTIDGTAVFLTANPNDIPYILKHHWLRVQSLHQRIVLLTIVPDPDPYVDEKERVKLEKIAPHLLRVTASFGFMELPELKPIVESCAAFGLHIDDDNTTFVVAAPQILRRTDGRQMWPARRWLFTVMQKLSGTLAHDLCIPGDRLIELGVDVSV